MSRTRKDRPRRLRELDPPPGRERRLPTTPRWWRRHVWYAPDRQRARVACRASATEFNTCGDVDTVIPAEQHRQNAKLLW
ncbi:hypothetical protein [Actinomadura atramentaria]|uniref:hypothetical protein n=1 Tax=Actinomadura atramentaria TaxID=1990 RepID=UPI0003773876|nr:hypothetical protein [Actinomadura atramentaria]